MPTTFKARARGRRDRVSPPSRKCDLLSDGLQESARDEVAANAHKLAEPVPPGSVTNDAMIAPAYPDVARVLH